MGFKVTTMHSVASGALDYYVYILEPTWSHTYKTWFDANFDGVAQRLGSNAAIVKGWDERLTSELVDFVEHWACDSSLAKSIERAAMSMVCLLISKGDIKSTDSQLLFVPIADCRMSVDGSDMFMSNFMDWVIKSMEQGCIESVIKELGGIEVELRNNRKGVFFSTLRLLNDLLLLQPNVAGVGVNLNSAIERIIGNPDRSRLMDE